MLRKTVVGLAALALTAGPVACGGSKTTVVANRPKAASPTSTYPETARKEDEVKLAKGCEEKDEKCNGAGVPVDNEGEECSKTFLCSSTVQEGLKQKLDAEVVVCGQKSSEEIDLCSVESNGEHYYEYIRVAENGQSWVVASKPVAQIPTGSE